MNKNTRGSIFVLIVFCMLMVSCCPGYKKISLNNYFHSNADKATVYIKVDVLTNEGITSSSGTGVAIDRDISADKSLILTAGHICVETIRPNVVSEKMTVYTISGDGFYSKIISIDPDFDLCLIEISKSLPIAKIAKKEPKTGDLIMYSGYPAGLYMPGTKHYFQGFMAGKDQLGDHLYNIPATGGSSGSPIYNSDKEIVAIVSAVMIDFEHMTFAVGTNNIRNFRDNTNWPTK